MKPTPTSPALLDAVGADQVFLVRPVAHPATLVERIRKTEGAHAEDVAARIRAARPDWLS